ncbi:hypothetical protein AGMMS49949_07340 [Alphaproteobacteria bacterium]|nr:hypothetical protein AGMMS49949_07340 [Alphaproteobacteria bacterium]GHS99822.1 hypothetical protein AGMMS50296_8080 [Alphaproteobacteria bacterium]
MVNAIKDEREALTHKKTGSVSPLQQEMQVDMNTAIRASLLIKESPQLRDTKGQGTKHDVIESARPGLAAGEKNIVYFASFFEYARPSLTDAIIKQEIQD